MKLKQIIASALTAGIIALSNPAANAQEADKKETLDQKIESSYEYIKWSRPRRYGMPVNYEGVSRIANFGEEAIPVSVKYLNKGNIDQKKIASQVLLDLREKVDDNHIDNIVKAYVSETNKWLKKDMRKTVISIFDSQVKDSTAKRYIDVMGVFNS